MIVKIFLGDWWARLVGLIDISGDWTLTVRESQPGGTGVTLDSFPVTVLQKGSDIYLSSGGVTLMSGSIEGRVLTLWGRYPDDQKTTEEHATATVNADGTKLEGGSTWTWGVADGVAGISAGTTTFSAVKT